MKALANCFSSALIVGAAVLAGNGTTALAATTVDGNPQALSVDAHDSSVAEILAALGKSFKLHYHASVDLGHVLTGTYEGSLPHVLQRVLEGYNFVMKSDPQGGIEVTVFGGQHAGPITAQSKPATPAAAPVAVSSGEAKPKAAEVVSSGDHSSDFEFKVAQGPGPQPDQSTKGPVPQLNTKVQVKPPQPNMSNPSAGPQLQPSTVTPPTPQLQASTVAPPTPPLSGPTSKGQGPSKPGAPVLSSPNQTGTPNQK